jgi:hypothetical protein
MASRNTETILDDGAKNKIDYPPAPSNRGKRGSASMPDGRRLHFTITDEFHVEQSGRPGKLIYLQLIKFDDGREQLRLGYYIIGKKPAMRGRWVWGQFATFMPAVDFREIVNLAEQRGWIP